MSTESGPQGFVLGTGQSDRRGTPVDEPVHREGESTAGFGLEPCVQTLDAFSS